VDVLTVLQPGAHKTVKKHNNNNNNNLYARYDNVVVVVRFVGLVRRKKELNELSKAEMLVATSFSSDRFSVISLSARMRNCFVFGTKRVLLIL